MYDKAADKYATEGISDTPEPLALAFSTKLETRLCNRAEAIFCGICRTLTMRSDTTTNQ